MPEQKAIPTATHRPSEIAALIGLGLGRRFAGVATRNVRLCETAIRVDQHMDFPAHGMSSVAPMSSESLAHLPLLVERP